MTHYACGTFQTRFLNRAAIIQPNPPSSTKKPNRWRHSTVTDIEEVKMVIRMLPIWATTIMFWTVYAQMTTFSISQAATMNRHVSPSFQIPSGSLTAFFVLSILLTIPFYDRLLVPVLRRGLSPLRRIGVGLALSVLAMVSAALTELRRLRASEPISVFWLVPQFFFVGSGEAFAYMGQLDFFLRECPEGMKTMSTGLFLSTLALGFFFSSAVVTVVREVTGEGGREGWLADDLNRGKLYDFYWLVAGLSGVNLMVFLVCSVWYVYRERIGETGEEEDDVV